ACRRRAVFASRCFFSSSMIARAARSVASALVAGFVFRGGNSVSLVMAGFIDFVLFIAPESAKRPGLPDLFFVSRRVPILGHMAEWLYAARRLSAAFFPERRSVTTS